jgi:preprotein translocase subunit SecE
LEEHRSPKPGVAGSRPVSPAILGSLQQKTGGMNMLKVGNFFSQVSGELKKVAWPSKEELTASTIVVLVSTFFLAIFIGIADILLSRIVNLLISGVFR